MEFKVGDLVWAKMKGYSTWPAKIIIPPNGMHRPKMKRPLHCVQFYGSNDCGWIGPNYMVPHNSELVNKASGKKGSKLRRAAEAIQFESQKNLITDSDDDYAVEGQQYVQPMSINDQNESLYLKTCRVTVKRLNLDIKEAKISEQCFSSRKIEEGNVEYGRPSKIRKISFSDNSRDTQIYPSCSSNGAKSISMRVGVVGLGTIGTGLVKKLLKSGFLVTVWNHFPEGLEDLAKDGALIAQSPANTIMVSSVIFCCLSDVEDVKLVIGGKNGILDGLDRCSGPGHGYVGLSVYNAEFSIKIGQEIKSKGGRYLEAPVIGSKICFNMGRLIVFASGEQSLFNDFETCFNAFSHVKYLGSNLGEAAKLSTVFNLFLGTFYTAFGEAKTLLKQMGLPETPLNNLASQLIESDVMVDTAEMFQRTFNPQDPIQNFLKDLDLKVLLAANFPSAL